LCQDTSSGAAFIVGNAAAHQPASVRAMEEELRRAGWELRRPEGKPVLCLEMLWR